MLGMVLKQDNNIGFLEEGEGTGFDSTSTLPHKYVSTYYHHQMSDGLSSSRTASGGESAYNVH